MLLKIREDTLEELPIIQDAASPAMNYLPLNEKEEEKTDEYYLEGRAVRIVQWTVMIIYCIQGTLLVKARGDIKV